MEIVLCKNILGTNFNQQLRTQFSLLFASVFRKILSYLTLKQELPRVSWEKEIIIKE